MYKILTTFLDEIFERLTKVYNIKKLKQKATLNYRYQITGCAVAPALC